MINPIRLYMSMSLDGYIAGPDDRAGQELGRDGGRLFNWLDDRESDIRHIGNALPIGDAVTARTLRPALHNMTRDDAREFLKLAAEIRLRPRVTTFTLDRANEALAAVKNDAIDGAAVIVP